MGRDRTELYLRHHRQPEGRGLSSPRSLSRRSGTVLAGSIPRHAVFLWTARCSTATAGASPGQQRRLLAAVVPTQDEAATILDPWHKVTDFGGAPIVHNLLLSAPAELWQGITHKVKASIAGAAPPLATIEAMEHHGVELTRVILHIGPYPTSPLEASGNAQRASFIHVCEDAGPVSILVSKLRQLEAGRAYEIIHLSV